jgi:hypothetical protein
MEQESTVKKLAARISFEPKCPLGKQDCLRFLSFLAITIGLKLDGAPLACERGKAHMLDRKPPAPYALHVDTWGRGWGGDGLHNWSREPLPILLEKPAIFKPRGAPHYGVYQPASRSKRCTSQLAADSVAKAKMLTRRGAPRYGFCQSIPRSRRWTSQLAKGTLANSVGKATMLTHRGAPRYGVCQCKLGIW